MASILTVVGWRHAKGTVVGKLAKFDVETVDLSMSHYLSLYNVIESLIFQSHDADASLATTRFMMMKPEFQRMA